MGKVVEKKKGKKKGRPSLLDLQKRSLRQQQQQQQVQQKRNSNPYLNPNFRNPIIPSPNPNPNRRFTRRNPNPDGTSVASDGIDAGDEDDDEDDDSNGKRREKKLRLVLRLPSNQQQRSSVKSPPLNSGSYGSDSNAENENGGTPTKKRKINAVTDGSGHRNSEKAEKPNFGSKATCSFSGTAVDSGPATPLPDKKLLLFILDRLQKKDTYGVFSEPVDPKELPDYHEVIEHPMDFGTVRKKLAGGAYASLEKFEKDVYLLCSNAMRYNAPDTIYFRQARSIQDLAKKDFENLRQDSDDNEPQPKVVRRGRPPTKNLKRPLGRPPFERAGSEFSSDATLATGGENDVWSNSYNLRKGPLSDKSGPGDLSGRISHGPHNSEAYISWYAEQKMERHDEFSGSVLKGTSVKNGKKQFVLDENRRNTYKQSHPSVVGREPSVLTAFNGDKKHLIAVGLHSEHGYARSLARFAANLGPIAWKVASKKIERALPVGFKFGPGLVGESMVTTPQLPESSSSVRGQPLQCQPISMPQISSSVAMLHVVESKGDKSSEKQDVSNNSVADSHRSRPHVPFAAVSTSSAVSNISLKSTTGVEAVHAINSQGVSGTLDNGGATAMGPRPSFQIHQGPVVRPGMNGFTTGCGFNIASQIGKLIRPPRPTGNSSMEASVPSPVHDMISRGNGKYAHTMPANCLDSEETKLLESSSTVEAGGSFRDSGCERQTAPGPSLPMQPSWRGLSLHQKPESIPPDLNIRFQSPGSPSSTVQPDLALQL